MADDAMRDFGPNGERRIARGGAADEGRTTAATADAFFGSPVSDERLRAIESEHPSHNPRRWPTSTLSPEERAARARLSRARWRENNPDYGRLWKQANPEKHRAHSRLSARRQKRRADRNANARRKYAENPEPHRERARRLRRDHPEKVAEYQRRFREKHPQRAVEQSRRASEKWRDSNASASREKGRRDAAARRQADPDQFRNWYHANLERERARGREASRLRSRLKALGLPPRKITRVHAADRRANDRAGEEFFSRRRLAPEVAALRRERDMPHAPRGVTARSRLKAEPSMPRDAAPVQDLARWVRESALAREGRTPDDRRAMLRDYLRQHARELREDVTLDSAFRVARGASPLDVNKEMTARAAAALRDAETERLTRVVNRALASYGLPPVAALQGRRASSTPTPRPSSSPRSQDQNRER